MSSVVVKVERRVVEILWMKDQFKSKAPERPSGAPDQGTGQETGFDVKFDVPLVESAWTLKTTISFHGQTVMMVLQRRIHSQ